MKVVIVGNSNCVFKYGFSKTVKDVLEAEGHTVINLSAGGSCSAYHIYVWHKNYVELQSADVVILDSMIIDVYHHRKKLVSDEKIAGCIHDMYALYSTLQAKVYTIYFPSLAYVHSFHDNHVYREHRKHSETYHIPRIDIYEEVGKSVYCDDFFMKDSHIHLQYSNIIAQRWCEHLMETVDEPRMAVSSRLKENPFTVVSSDDVIFEDLSRHTEESSYISHEVAVLDRPVSLERYAGYEVFGLFQWNRTHVSKLAISNREQLTVRRMRGVYSVFEIFQESPLLDVDSTITFADESLPVTAPPFVEDIEDSEAAVPNIAGLLLKVSGRDLRVKPAKQARKHARLNLPELVQDVFSANNDTKNATSEVAS